MNRQRGMVAAIASLALLAAATTCAATVVAAEDACSLNTIRGTYGWEMKGQTFSGGLSSETLCLREPRREIGVSGLAGRVETESGQLVVQLALARSSILLSQPSGRAIEQRRHPRARVDALGRQGVQRVDAVATLGLVCLG